MFDFDSTIERQSDKCRKWDHPFVCSRFGAVPKTLFRYGLRTWISPHLLR